MPIPPDLYESPTWQDVLATRPEKLGVRDARASIYHDREELYDLVADPHETTNLFKRPEYADIVARMREELLAMREATGDPLLSGQETLFSDPRLA
jgi:hypothetical protein